MTNMGALYEDVERFFGDIFASYGRLLARFPWVFIGISVVVCSLLGLGLSNLRVENNVEKLYVPMESPTLKDKARLETIFPEDPAENFYSQHLLSYGTYGTVIVTTSPPGGNVLEQSTMFEIRHLLDIILNNVTVTQDGYVYKYEDLCPRRNGNCVIEGFDVLKRNFSNDCTQLNHSYPDPLGYTYHQDNLDMEDMQDFLSGIKLQGSCMEATALKVTFHLKINGSGELHKLWEQEFLDTVASYSDSSELELVYKASESLNLELFDHVRQDMRFFPFTVVILVVYAAVVGSGGNWVSTHMLLAQTGVLSTLLAILAAYGACSLFGLPFVDISGVMPFIVLGVGVDDMFLLLSGWRQTSLEAPVEERVAEAFRSTATSITIMSLTDLLAFCIGATSPFLNIRIFCATCGLAMFFCYLNQLTFFGGCLVLNARRVQKGRHCITCLETKSASENEEAGRNSLYVALCSGRPPRKPGDDDNICKRIPKSAYPRLLMQLPAKAFVIVLYITYIGLCTWGISSMTKGLKLEEIISPESYLAKFNDREQKYFQDSGPVITFAITKPVAYFDPDIQKRIQHVVKEAQETEFVQTNCSLSWLDDFLLFVKKSNMTSPDNMYDFTQILKKQFLPVNPKYNNDIIMEEASLNIMASRIYVYAHAMQNSTMEAEMLIALRELVHNTSLPLTVYSPQFMFYEHHVSILKNTLLTVVVAIISMLLIALMFIPHPIAVFCVTVSMVSVVVGMMGFLYFWGLSLSVVKMIQIILSVGLCVNFTVHISHSFMITTGKSRNERVSMAIEKVGGTIANGAIALFLGIVMLAFGKSYLFTSFFKSMFMVMILGLVHAMVLLPVLLSFIGPRRTCRPKVFIPISPSCRSIQSDFNPYFSAPKSGDSTKTLGASDSNTESNPSQTQASSATNEEEHSRDGSAGQEATATKASEKLNIKSVDPKEILAEISEGSEQDLNVTGIPDTTSNA